MGSIDKSVSAPGGPSTYSTTFVATSVSNPRLTSTNASSIRVFLRSYDQYARYITDRAKQLVGKDIVTSEPITPVQLKICVDPDLIQSIIDLDFLPDVSPYDDRTDEPLRTYSDSKTEDSKQVVTLDAPDDLVSAELRTDMSDAFARSRMENVLPSYLSLLRLKGLYWIVKDNQKVSVSHVFPPSRLLPYGLDCNLTNNSPITTFAKTSSIL